MRATVDLRWLTLGLAVFGFGCGTELRAEHAPQQRDVGAVVGRAGEAAPAPAAKHDLAGYEVRPRERDTYSRLAVVVAGLGEEVTTRSPGTALAIAVHVRDERDERAEFRGDVAQQPASAAKIVWAAAALTRTSIEKVAPHAEPAIVVSNNCSAANLINLAGGVEDVNAFYERAGMRESGVRHWDVGCTKRALAHDSNERSNRMTAHDGVSFLDRLMADALLPRDKKDALLGWMKASPKTGTGGWLTARLPEPVRRNAMHKAGWTDRTTNEIGLVTTESNKTYAVALLASDGKSTAKQGAFLAYASCVIYQAVENGDEGLCQ